ncbi:MAG: hydrogenase [Spirochaetes bacterium]|nr:hydrogenase [Spirochaetota bacterium]MBL7006746.1 hydrogenase [Spirochaetia bacterium]
MALLLIFFPLGMALLAIVIPSNHLRPWLLPVTGIVHTFGTVVVILHPELGSQSALLILDPVGIIVLIAITLLFLVASFYTVGYLHYRKERSNRIFSASLLAFLGLISLVIWSHDLGLMWVAMEGTTLVTAPLIYFNHTKKSIEATWKYLLVGSVGIALALLGTFFLAYSSMQGGFKATLLFDELLNIAPGLSKIWLKASFILLLIGYGTKMGLAPMHTWKPDAYGEAPGVVGAVFAGGVTSGAFLALLRIYQICDAAGETLFTANLLKAIGLFSMVIAGIFLIGQRDIKRMLAYSSVEHMGILALGLGIGAPALYGTLLHIITNALTKGVLFLSAGNIHRAYESKSTDQVKGVLRSLPFTGVLFLLGFFAITGSPPFGPFISEFAILNGAFAAGNFGIGAIFLLLLLLVFIGMSTTVFKTLQGRTPLHIKEKEYTDNFLTIAPIVVCLILVLFLGLHVPEPLKNLLNDAAAYMENR